MKKITCALLSLFMITPCFANIHIRSEAVESVIKQKIPGQDAQVAAAAEYNAHVKKANNAGIPASGIWQVCKAVGWNTQTADGEAKCRDFGNTLMKYATWKFKAVCGEDNSLEKKGLGKCVGDVFSNKVLGGVKVNMLVAPGLAKEYARVKFADKDLVCNPKYRSTTIPPDDYVQCLSMNKNMAYEFRFDSVTATMDNTINEGTESGVCKIFGLKYSPLGVTLDTAYSKGTSWPAACETTDAKICSKVNESMAKFGRSAKIGTTGSTGNKHSACVITKNAISSPSQLRTAFGIDNYVFKKGGVQLNATQTLKTQVCTYVRTTVKSPAITSCDCNDGFTQLYDFSGMITETDDVLTCKINGKNVDFVFDDLSERNRKIATGGSQGMDCMAAGGTYAGQQCMYLDEKQCKMLAKANLQNCPTCKKVEYKNGVCQLPSGADAVQAQKNQRIALIVGGAVVGVVVTVATAGTAGAPVSAVVFTLVETGGAVMEYNAQVKIDAIADEFLLTSQKCKSASCAENLVKQNLQRLSNVADDMQVAERNAVDKELARLVELLPNDSQLFIDILGGESLIEANHKPLFDADSWEPEQVWRAVGITLQMTSVFGAVGKWVLKSTGVLAKDLPEATIKITRKAKLAREGIIKTGKTVKTTDGTIIKTLGNANINLPDFLQSVADVHLVQKKGSRSAVYGFKNTKTGKTYFLKYNSDTQEIERTKRAHRVLSDCYLTRGPSIVETDFDVIRSFAESHGITIPEERVAFIMESAIDELNVVPATEFLRGDVDNILRQLGGAPLSIENQELIIADIKRLNNSGLNHGDLVQNMYIYWDASDGLKVYIIDYESWTATGSITKDTDDIKELFTNMQKRGLAKNKIDKSLKPLSYYINGLDNIADDEEVIFNIKLNGKKTYGKDALYRIKNILDENGFKSGTYDMDLNSWYIRQSKANNSDLGNYEIWSPTMKAKEAKARLPKLIQDFDDANLSSNMIIPIKAKDFFNNFDVPVHQVISNTEIKEFFRQTKSASNIYNSLDEISEQYPSDKFLFKGATASNDYMLFSGRPGRSGTVYATPNIKYAALYDGVTGKGGGLTATGDRYGGLLFGSPADGYPEVGFINIYKQSPNNVYYDNFGIENYRKNPYINTVTTDANKAETHITPEENPLVEQILHFRRTNPSDGAVTEFYVPVGNQSDAEIQSIIERIINNSKANVTDTYEAPLYNRLKSQKEAL